MSDIIKWGHRLYSEGVDKKDAAMFAAAFTDDCSFRFGNNPPLTSREEIEAGVAQFFSLFASLSHEPTGTTLQDRTLVLESNVTYTLHNGGTVTVPACTIFRLADSSELRARTCQIYVDLTPLFSSLG